jgi:hypothetical protein
VARFDRAIPPGGEGKIVLKVETKGLQGKMSKTALVTSNDPKKPTVTIVMKGKVWVPIHLRPTYARLTGIVGDTIKTVVYLRGEKEDPLVIKIASVSIPDKVAVELNELEKGRKYHLKIRNKVEKAMSYRGQVTLTTNYPEKPQLVVKITGYIRPPVEVRPRALRFLSLTEERLQLFKKEEKVIKLSLMVVYHKPNGFKVDKVELEKALYKIHIEEKPAGRMQRGSYVRLMVEPILEKLKKGHNTDRLKIFTNQKDHEILEVPIFFTIY